LNWGRPVQAIIETASFDGNEMTIEINPFGIDSYDPVFALWKQCEGVGLSDSDSRECIRAYLDRNPGMSFLVTSGDSVVGAVLAGHDGRRGYINHLAVHPDHRRQGLARKLVARCMAELAGAGIPKCHVFIFNDNSGGIEFWKSIGWVQRSDIGVLSKVL
jgi:putative acetyltransferase